MQNDLGSAAVIGVCAGAILLVAGIRVRHAVVLVLLAITAVGAVISTGTLDDYKIDRIASFFDQSTGESAQRADASRVQPGTGEVGDRHRRLRTVRACSTAR